MILKIRLANFPGCQALLLLGLGLCGCATQHKPASKAPTFFPPAPDEPRIQYLASFSSDRDLGRSASFADFITGKPVTADPVVKPYGVAIKDGSIFVCDTVAAEIHIFDLVRRRSRSFKPRGEGLLQTPINITIDQDGTRYISDTARNQVLIFGPDETWIAAMGAKDEMKPADVAVTADRLYVSDLKGHCVKVYDKKDRKLLFSIPREANPTQGKLFSPSNLAIDPEGRLLVADGGSFAVQVYDLEGKFLGTIGQVGVAPGRFARPRGVAVDREGRALVTDAASQVAQMFDKEGRLLIFFGLPGGSTQGELYGPAAIKVDYDNVKLFQDKVAPGFDLDYLILVINQFGDNKVSVYGFLKKR